MTTPREVQVLKVDDRGDDNDGERLSSWEDVQNYWLSFSASTTTPDIVLCDVNFESDNKSPLDGHCKQKPTGFL